MTTGLKRKHVLAASGSNPGAAYQAKIIADGATNYWPLNEISGTVARDIIGGKNATISAGVTLNQPGIAGGVSMKFDATTDNVITPTLTIPSTYTIELWLNPLGSISRRPFSFRPQVAYILDRQANGTLQIYDGSFHAGTTVLTAGVWHHVVIMVTVPTMTIYTDGILDYSFATTITGMAGPLKLSNDPPDSTAFFDGFIQNVAIYTLNLSPAQIAAHYALR